MKMQSNYLISGKRNCGKSLNKKGAVKIGIFATSFFAVMLNGCKATKTYGIYLKKEVEGYSLFTVDLTTKSALTTSHATLLIGLSDSVLINKMKFSIGETHKIDVNDTIGFNMSGKWVSLKVTEFPINENHIYVKKGIFGEDSVKIMVREID